MSKAKPFKPSYTLTKHGVKRIKETAHVRCATSFMSWDGPSPGTIWHIPPRKDLLIVDRVDGIESRKRVYFKSDHLPMLLKTFISKVMDGELILHGVSQIHSISG